MNVEKALRGIVLTGVFALPLIVFIVSDSTFFPYIVGKNIAFRSIVEVMFGAWILLALLNAEYRPRWTVLLLSILSFVVIVTMADLFGENPYKSIWSNFERMDGLVTLLHLLMYTVAAGAVMNTRNLWLWLMRVSIAVSTFVSVHAIGQLILTEKSRLDSTLGNPIYLAVYLLFHIFILLIVIARPQAERIERVIGVILLPLFFIALFFTATRGATLGLIGGLLLATLGIVVSLRGNKKVRLATGIVALLILTSIGTFFLARNTTFVQENHVLKRFASISLSEGTVYSRTLIWGIAWEGVKERPLLGWGQENFNFVFNKHYDPRMHSQEPWFDRTHNVVFDWLIAAGLLGLLAYISIFLATLWTLYKTEAFTTVQKWLLVGLLAAYSFHNLTVFDNVISYLLFFTVLAWIYSSSDDVWNFRKKGETNPWTLSKSQGLLIGAPILIVVTFTVVWFINVKPWQAATTLLNALAGVHVAHLEMNQTEAVEQDALKNLDSAFESFIEAESLSTYGTQEVSEQWSESAKRVAIANWVPVEKKNEWYTAAINALEKQQVKVPNDARYPFFIGSTHYGFGNFVKARENFERALELSPNKQRILALLVASTANANDLEASLEYARTSFEVERNYTQARILYANVLIRNDLVDEALVLLNEVPVYSGDEGVLNALINKGLHKEARDIWSQAFIANEGVKNNDVGRLFSLVRIYVARGNLNRATEEVVYIKQTYPEFTVVADQALEELSTLSQ